MKNLNLYKLEKREIKNYKGGASCSCGCLYANSDGSSSAGNSSANNEACNAPVSFRVYDGGGSLIIEQSVV